MWNVDNYGFNVIEFSMLFKRVMVWVYEVIVVIVFNDSVERYINLGVDVVKGYVKIWDFWIVDICKSDGNM